MPWQTITTLCPRNHKAQKHVCPFVAAMEGDLGQIEPVRTSPRTGPAVSLGTNEPSGFDSDDLMEALFGIQEGTDDVCSINSSPPISPQVHKSSDVTAHTTQREATRRVPDIQYCWKSHMAMLQFLGPCPFISVGREGDCGWAAIRTYLNMVKGAHFEPPEQWDDVQGIRAFVWEWALFHEEQAKDFCGPNPIWVTSTTARTGGTDTNINFMHTGSWTDWLFALLADGRWLDLPALRCIAAGLDIAILVIAASQGFVDWYHLGNTYRNDGLVVPIALHNEHWFLIKRCPLRPFPEWWFSVRATLPEPQHLYGGRQLRNIGTGSLSSNIPTCPRRHRMGNPVRSWPTHPAHYPPYSTKHTGGDLSISTLKQGSYTTIPHKHTNQQAQAHKALRLARPDQPLVAGCVQTLLSSVAIMPCVRCGGTHPIGLRCQKPTMMHQADRHSWDWTTHGDNRWRPTCAQCQADWKERSMWSCLCCAQTNDKAARRIEVDQGKTFRVDTVAFQITGYDINSTYMEEHLILADVATYFSTIQTIAVYDNFGLRREAAAQVQRTYEDACKKHAGLPPAHIASDTQAWDKWARDHSTRRSQDRQGSQHPANQEYPSTTTTRTEPSSAHQQVRHSDPGLAGASTAGTLGSLPSNSGSGTIFIAIDATGPSIGPLMVNGIPYALDPNDVGLFSVEKQIPVLSREYQQENYVPRTSHSATSAASETRTNRVEVHTPTEPVWPPGASPFDLVYNRLILEMQQHTHQVQPGGRVQASQSSDTQAQQHGPSERTSPPPLDLDRTVPNDDHGTRHALAEDYDGPFKGTACDYVSSGHSTCTKTAEVCVKTNKYKQLRLPRAAWARQQQDQSRQYTSSFSGSGSSTSPWVAQGSDTPNPPGAPVPPLPSRNHRLNITNQLPNHLAGILGPFVRK